MTDYSDILNTEAPIELKHRRMARENRAAQFMPFAALTGYGASIEEAARVTEKQPELTESLKTEMDRKLKILAEHRKESPEVTITYFEPDPSKDGGKTCRVSGVIRKFSSMSRSLVLEGGRTFAFDEILDLDSPVLQREEASRDGGETEDLYCD